MALSRLVDYEKSLGDPSVPDADLAPLHDRAATAELRATIAFAGTVAAAAATLVFYLTRPRGAADGAR